MPYSNTENPVILPPGRAKLSTNPLPTRSTTCANTIGTLGGGKVQCPVPHSRLYGPLPAARALAVNRTSELHAASLGSSKGRLGPSRDHSGLKLGNRRHLLQQELACCAFDHRKISKAHVNARLQQTREEGDRAGPGMAAKGNYERRAHRQSQKGASAIDRATASVC